MECALVQVFRQTVWTPSDASEEALVVHNFKLLARRWT